MAQRLPAVRQGDVLVLIGTLKGAFIFHSRPGRTRWQMSGPHFPGHSVYAMAYDGRAGRNRLWAAASSEHWGAVLRTSDDFGRRWTDPERPNVVFPESAGAALARIWQIQPGLAEDPDTLYCGVEPAALFQSIDAGETWTLARGLWDHPHRARWTPGFGGLCLHTIVLDPLDARRILIATSTGGVYRSEDSGRSWQASNRGIRAYFLPDKSAEFGQCVHKMLRHPASGRLFLQHHYGVYRSDDGGLRWKNIGRGLPSDFGFPIVAHPHEPDTVYVVPLHSDRFRVPPGGRLRVYRARRGKGPWRPLTAGLPQQDAFETVLRDGMAADSLKPAGLYFGTRSGKLFASRDDGRSWKRTADGLPPVVCVKAAVVGTLAKRGVAGRRAA